MAGLNRNLDIISSTVTLLTVVLVAVIWCTFSSSVNGAYFYNTNTNTNTHHHSKHNSGYYSQPQHHVMHHKHHQHHGSNSGKIHQAAVGVVSRGRLVPYTATTTTTTPSPRLSPSTTTPNPRLSPLERLMNKLDTVERQSSQTNHQHHAATRFHDFSHLGNRRHDPISPSMLRSSLSSSGDRRFAQLRSRTEDSYEDDEEDDDEDEDEDDEDDDKDEDEDDDDDDSEDNEDERYAGVRHPHLHHSNSRGGQQSGDVPWYDGELADFPDLQAGSSGSGSGGDSDTGSGTRWGGYRSYSEYKWNVLNKPNMDMLRTQREPATLYKTSPSDSDIAKAMKHAIAVNKEGHCRTPKPRLIQVKDLYPHPSKTYFPHCAILHQCSDDTGCCKSDTLTCTYRTSEPVELFFYTTTLVTSGGSRTSGGTMVEKLVFYNHTECTCVDRTQDLMPRDRPSTGSELDNLGRHGFRGYYRPDTDSGKSDSEELTCRCPSQFSARHLPDGSCECDCFDKQRDCIRTKRGKDYLPHHDRLCVLRQECTAPSCEFGSYMRMAGRCPRKRDKFEAWQHKPLHDEEYK